MPNLKTQGEWGFLNRLLPKLKKQAAGRFVVPPGDDAAVLKNAGRSVLSIDGLTEGTHFKSNWDTNVRALLGVGFGRALGWKLLGSGLSDLAAMGQTSSRWAMVYLAAPPKTSMKFLMDLYEGVRETCGQYGVAMAGGDTVRGRDLSLVVAVGATLKGSAVLRRGASPGDALCVSGTVGDAQRGLDILLGRHQNLSRADKRYFVSRFFRVEPRFQDGEKLAMLGATSLMDLSDPLLSSVRILAASSGVGADVVVEDIPVSATWARSAKPNPSLLSAGEDYGLLFTAPRNRLKKLRKHVSFHVIGAIRSASHGVQAYVQNKRINPHGIFEHFS